MTRRASIVLSIAALAVLTCGRGSRPGVAPEQLEPLSGTNTVCYKSFTFDQHGFGDSTRLAEADTSYLVIHGLADTLVGTTSGPAWLALAADGWGVRRDSWHRTAADSFEIAFTFRESRHQYQLALFEEAARGIGLEFAGGADSSAGAPAVARWNMLLPRIHCSGLRQPTDPPVRRPPDSEVRSPNRVEQDHQRLDRQETS